MLSSGSTSKEVKRDSTGMSTQSDQLVRALRTSDVGDRLEADRRRRRRRRASRDAREALPVEDERFPDWMTVMTTSNVTRVSGTDPLV